MAATQKLPPKPRAANVKAKRKRPTPVSERGKKKPRKKIVRKNLPLFSIAILFCGGILLGSFLINRADISEFYNHSARPKHITQTTQATQNTPITPTAPTAPTSKPTPKPIKTPVINLAETEHAEPATTATIEPLPKTPIAITAISNKGKPSSYTPTASSTIVAIVIDDIGYQHKEGERTLQLPGKLTVAVIPFTPFGKALAQEANHYGKEVMLHAPMEPKKLSHWGEGLNANMNEIQLRKSFVAMIGDIPNIVGINNHMGSGLTENSQIMNWLMAELPERELYFIDSRTSAKSQAFNAAQKHGVQSYSRDVFLDDSKKVKDISRQLDTLIAKAKKQGMALGIGHPYPQTLTVLEQRLPQLKAQGIELVTVSELLNAKNNRTRLALNAKKIAPNDKPAEVN